MHVVYCLAYICIHCRTADVLVGIDLTLSLSPCYVQLLRNAGINSIFFFTQFGPFTFVTQRPLELNLEKILWKQVLQPHVSAIHLFLH